jgi:hypothetical protein
MPNFTYYLSYSLGETKKVMEHLKISDFNELKRRLYTETGLELEASCRNNPNTFGLVVELASERTGSYSCRTKDEEPESIDDYDNNGVSLDNLEQAAKEPLEKLLKFFPLYKFDKEDYYLSVRYENDLM